MAEKIAHKFFDGFKSGILRKAWLRWRENAKKHVPFAGERSLGEKAKLYLSLERKDNEVVSDRPGTSATDS